MITEEREVKIREAVEGFRDNGIGRDTEKINDFADLLMQANREDIEAILKSISEDSTIKRYLWWSILHTLDMDTSLDLMYAVLMVPQANEAVQIERDAMAQPLYEARETIASMSDRNEALTQENAELKGKLAFYKGEYESTETIAEDNWLALIKAQSRIVMLQEVIESMVQEGMA